MAETVIGYVYDKDGYHDGGRYFEGTMENIASFIMENQWHDTIITDLMDDLIAKSFTGGFLDKVDPSIREDLLKELVPIQLGEKEPQKIDYLNGEPGVYSARYLGEDTSYDIKNQIILDRLKGVPDEQRAARFVCAIACVLPDGTVLTSKDTMEGRIGYEIAGANGFGYDPIFYLPEFGCTSAEISPEQKNAISHRGKALQQMKKLLEQPT